jgi:aspartate 1-decarboxylase
MLRSVLYCKIHRATVTAALPDYIGSITIDADILDAVGLRPSDQVTVANCRNGNRCETYVFFGERGSKRIELNGAAAHLFEVGDKVIVMHYAMMTDAEYAGHHPRVAIMGEGNRVERVMRYDHTRPNQ